MRGKPAGIDLLSKKTTKKLAAVCTVKAEEDFWRYHYHSHKT